MVKSNAARTACAGLVSIGLVMTPFPALANGPQGTESSSYEEEMMKIIESRPKARVLEVKAAPALTSTSIIEEAVPVKVEVSMNVEQRSEAIRARAISEAKVVQQLRTGAAAPTTVPNYNVALLGLFVVAMGGAAAYNVYTQNEALVTSSSSPSQDILPSDVNEISPMRESTPSLP